MKILEIIKQIEYSGVLFGLSNKILYHEGRSTLQGAVLGSTSQLFLDIWGLVRDSSLVVSENEYRKTQVKTIHRCWVLFLVEGATTVSS